ncbi:hypothetical protein DSUL_140067 [Desulfovibrionales bacterium]
MEILRFLTMPKDFPAFSVLCNHPTGHYPSLLCCGVKLRTGNIPLLTTWLLRI